MDLDTLKANITELNAKASLRTKAEVIVVIIFAVVLWWVSLPPKANVGEWVPGKPSSDVAHVGTEVVPCKQIEVLKPEAKDKLNLPSNITNNPSAHVIGAVTVKPGERPTTVATVVDTDTGKSETITRTESYPWLAAEQRGEVRLDLGITPKGTAGRLSITENLLQIKAVHLGVVGSFDTSGQMFAGVGVGYKW